MALNDSEKERFRKLMRRTETFSGVRILTHSVLDNHFTFSGYGEAVGGSRSARRGLAAVKRVHVLHGCICADQEEVARQIAEKDA